MIVQGITIKSESIASNTFDNTRAGLEIGTGEGNELSEVKFQDLDIGMTINGGGSNAFYDLQFVRVGIPELQDCIAANNTTSAVELIGSGNNSFTNIAHNFSPSSVTVKLDGLCNNNTILNIAVEQEGSKCTDGGVNGVVDDPCLYITNPTITGNIITCNFNHRKTTVVQTMPITKICADNKISDLPNCDYANLEMG